MRLATLKHLPKALLTCLAHGRPDFAVHFSAGLGDELLQTCVLQALKRAKPGSNIWVLSKRPELYQGSTDASAVLPVTPVNLRLAQRLGAKILPLRYTDRDDRTPSRDLSPPAHVLEIMLCQAGLTGTHELRPVLQLSPEELARMARYTGALVVQSGTAAAVRPNPMKEYPNDKYARALTLITGAAGGRRLVQIGSPSDPRLPGCEDLRGLTTLRESAAILAHARLFLGFEGGVMHLARSQDCPAVILFGGRTRVEQIGYAEYTNLLHPMPCSPCWEWERCDHAVACLGEVSPEQIADAVLKALEGPKDLANPGQVTLSAERHQQLASYLSLICRNA